MLLTRRARLRGRAASLRLVVAARWNRLRLAGRCRVLERRARPQRWGKIVDLVMWHLRHWCYAPSILLVLGLSWRQWRCHRGLLLQANGRAMLQRSTDSHMLLLWPP